MSKKTIKETLRAYVDHWMAMPEVVSVGIGEHDRQECIRILVRENSVSLEAAIPSEIDGFRVIVDESGPIHAIM